MAFCYFVAALILRTRFCSWRDGSASCHIICFHAAGDVGSGQLVYGAAYTGRVSLIRTGDDLWQMCTDYRHRYRVSGKVLPAYLLTMVHHVLNPCFGLGGGVTADATYSHPKTDLELRVNRLYVPISRPIYSRFLGKGVPHRCKLVMGYSK